MATRSSERGPGGGSPAVAISWKGLPNYAARLIRAAIARLPMPCAVIGSAPDVPVRGMEEVLGQDIIWIDDTRAVSWADLGLEPPRIFFQSGWGYPAFNALGREVKQAGGKVVLLSDANFRRDFRQLVLGPIGFRLLHKPNIDCAIVPGLQGRQVMRHFGMPADRVFTGYYGADPSLFNGGAPLQSRPKTFLYVGQFIERKDILNLARAFIDFVQSNPGWTLRMVGNGPLKGQIPAHPRILVEDFVQPEQLAALYRQARFFVLPSLVEAWGLVVHEAALTGCGLLLSDAIGSAPDLAADDNAIRFRAGSRKEIAAALTKAAGASEEEMIRAEHRSRQMALQFGPERFALACQAAITRCGANLDRSRVDP